VPWFGEYGVAVDAASGLFEDREQARWQRPQQRLFDRLEELADLLADRSVDAGVGNGPLPLEQMLVLFGQAAKRASLDRVVLRILDPSLDLGLVTGHGGPGREDDRTVVLRQLLELGVEPGVIKVGIDHPRLEVVDHDGGGNAPEGSEGVFEVPDEVLGRLPRCGLGVALAGVAQDSAKQMRAAPLALHEDPSSLPEVDLELVSRGALHASEGDLSRLLKAADEAFDRMRAVNPMVPALA